MRVGIALMCVLVAVMAALAGCSYGYREDVDQIGSIRRTHTLGWKEGPREEAYRPYRNQTNYYQSDCPQQGAPVSSAPASPNGPSDWQPWMK